MGLQREKITSNPTMAITVLVQFQNADGSLTQGDFKGTFKRVEQRRVDDMAGAGDDAPWTNSEVLDEVLVGVSGISDGTTELPADEQLAWVKQTPECVNAAVAAFFKAMRAERYVEKTSSKRRSRG